ncbi:MAG TPA: TadE/TadG family type IV pilus assembly protein [Acidothermaceae bacterium]
MEFALVLPILVLILFGIIDYGLYFSNTLSAESGVQTAARQATVGALTPCPSSITPPADASPQVAELMCMVKVNTGSITGTAFVAVVFPGTDPTTTGWFPGQELIVCEVIDVAGLTGYVPLPRHAGQVAIRSKVVTQIQSIPLTQQVPDKTTMEASPPGGWGWCT